MSVGQFKCRLRGQGKLASESKRAGLKKAPNRQVRWSDRAPQARGGITTKQNAPASAILRLLAEGLLTSIVKKPEHTVGGKHPVLIKRLHIGQPDLSQKGLWLPIELQPAHAGR